jgi:hypothetical protein
MDNPVPSVMVYFDEKEGKAILCLDKPLPPPAVVSRCEGGEGHDFHTHTWVKLGWMSEAVFHSRCREPIRGLAIEFVRDVLLSVIAIRDDFNQMRTEREAELKSNQRLRGIIRELVAGLDGTICHIESEEKRLEVAKLIGKHASRILMDTGAEGEAS